MYFEGGVSSVYLWDLDAGFAGVILIKKAGDGSKKIKGEIRSYFLNSFFALKIILISIQVIIKSCISFVIDDKKSDEISGKLDIIINLLVYDFKVDLIQLTIPIRSNWN